MSLPVIWPGSAQLIKGTLQPIKQKSILRFVKGKGWTTVDVWESATEAAAKGLAQDLALAGYTNVEVSSPDQVKWRVEASIEGQGEGSSDEPVDTWELLSTAEQVDILSHPTSVGISNDVISDILDHINNPRKDVQFIGATADETELYRLQLRGVKSYAKPEHILRNTVSGSDTQLAGRIVMAGELQIWAKNQLPTLPASILAAIDAMPVQYEMAGAGITYEYGFLKQPPTIVVDVFGHATFTQEWHGPEWWSTYAYRVYGA